MHRSVYGCVAVIGIAGVDDLALAKSARSGLRRSAGHYPALASSGVSGLLALEISRSANFERLFAFLVVGHGRRQLLWFAVTRHPTAEWLAQQIVEAFPWNTAPTYLVRDNDGAYGQAFRTRIRTMGIRDRPISPRSPWQNPYAERLIGTLRRDCLDHILIFGEWHLLRILSLYSGYYHFRGGQGLIGRPAQYHRRSMLSWGALAVSYFSGTGDHAD